MARQNRVSAHDVTNTTHDPRDTPDSTFSGAEWSRLAAVRQRFAQRLDLFSEYELAHLRFLRWLVQSGRLTA